MSNAVSSEKVLFCSTASSTQAKTVALTGFTLSKGSRITVCFENGNTVSSPTLNVNSTGAKEIRIGTSTPLAAKYGSLNTGCYTWNTVTLELYYNGTYWLVLGNPKVFSWIGVINVYIDGYKEGKKNVNTVLNSQSGNLTFYESDYISTSYDTKTLNFTASVQGLRNPSIPFYINKISYIFEADDKRGIQINYSGTSSTVVNNTLDLILYWSGY